MTDTISGLVRALGLELPRTAPPAANYVPYVVSGPLLFLAGQVAQFNGTRPYVGKLGGTLSVEDGIRAAELCALNLLAWVAAATGDDAGRIARCVRLGGFVNCVPDFVDQPKVINGASDLIVNVLGERGRHARTAVGANVLPFDIAVEIDAIFELR